MPLFEVYIDYTGRNVYTIEAESHDEAEYQAKTRYFDGDNGDPAHGFEDVRGVTVEEVQPE